MQYANIYAEGRSGNSLFAINDDVHKYNPTYTPRLLRNSFLDFGIELNTPDLNIGKQTIFDLYIEGSACTINHAPKFLLALENPHINTLNVNLVYISQFSKVFSWDLRLQDLSNVIPIMIPHPMRIESFFSFSKRTIFSCLINANKAFKKPLSSDLYLERIKTIKWYESNALDYFKLYGLGWDKHTSAFNYLDKIKRSISIAKSKLFNVKAYPSYQGSVDNKYDILKISKFAFCYENSSDLKNYVTEKIFDCMVCGCIPIYWGAENVDQFIPINCYIDRRNFKDTAEIHNFLVAITESQYQEYQSNISAYLKTDAAYKFNSKFVVDTIVKNITEYVKKN